MTKRNRSYRKLSDTTRYGAKNIKPVERADTTPVPLFLLIKGPQKGRPLPIPEGHWTIGRGSESDISVQGRGISRIHLQLESAPDGSVKATDCNSTNGMLVNGNWVREHHFSAGDILQLGPEVACKFTLLPACELDMQLHLYDQSILDDLTGLYNRRYLIDTLRRSISAAFRRRKPLCLVVVDIDRFKQINDTHGHGIGDKILAQFAALLDETLRTEDVCARIGGEEFALILGDLDLQGCRDAVERIRVLIASHPF